MAGKKWREKRKLFSNKNSVRPRTKNVTYTLRYVFLPSLSTHLPQMRKCVDQMPDLRICLGSRVSQIRHSKSQLLPYEFTKCTFYKL
jgi:hypothetical protein